MTSERTPRRRRGIGLAGACVLAAALSAGAPGCEHEQPTGTVKQVIDLSTLPPNVRQAAQNALPGVTLQDAWKNVDAATKALHSYEVRGRNARGKIREVRVSTSGDILEME
jgi:hypothetical protein